MKTYKLKVVGELMYAGKSYTHCGIYTEDFFNIAGSSFIDTVFHTHSNFVSSEQAKIWTKAAVLVSYRERLRKQSCRRFIDIDKTGRSYSEIPVGGTFDRYEVEIDDGKIFTIPFENLTKMS